MTYRRFSRFVEPQNIFIVTHKKYAEKCKEGITGRYYADKLVVPEYSPVTDFREGRCRQYEDNSCKRGGKCNFMHVKLVPRDLKKALYKEMFNRYPAYEEYDLFTTFILISNRLIVPNMSVKKRSVN